jgi:predicted RecB family endonuclease
MSNTTGASGAAVTLVLGVRDEAGAPLAAVRESVEQIGKTAEGAGQGLDTLAGRGLGLAQGLSQGFDQGASAAQRFVREYGAATEAFTGFEGQLAGLGLRGASSNLAASPLSLRVDVSEAKAELARVAAPALGIPALADGGQVFRRLAAPLITRGSGVEDDVPALLMRDEFVMRREAVREYGLDVMYALNEGRLNKKALADFGISNVARFAKGGSTSAASGALASYAAPEFDPARFFTSPEAMSLLASKVAFWTQADADAFVSERVDSVSGNLDLAAMRGAPQAYLNAMLSTYSSGVRAFATGGDVSAATAELARKKALLNEEYSVKIAAAKALGNEEIALLWESQLLALEELIASLRESLEDMVLEHRELVDEIAGAYREALASLRAEYGERMASLRQELCLANKNLEVARGINEAQMRASGVSMPVKSLVAAQNQARANVESLEREEAGAESATTATYAAAIGKERANLEREAKRETADQERAGRSIKLEQGSAIRSAYLEALRDAQSLEIAWRKAIAELESAYSSTKVTGFSHWLSGGGLASEGEVKPLPGAVAALWPLTRLAVGGSVPFHAGAARGKDSVLALLAPGEFVLSADAVQGVGLEYLRRLNGLDASARRSMAPVLGFSGGGAVPGGALAASLPRGAGPGETHEVRLVFNGATSSLQGTPSNARALVKQLRQLKRSMCA